MDEVQLCDSSLKEEVRKRQNSNQSSRGSNSSRISRKSFRLDYRLEEDVTKSKKGKNGRFINPWTTWKPVTVLNVLKWIFTEKDNSKVPRSKQVLDRQLPVLTPYFVPKPELFGKIGAGMRVTWLGHASVLVEMDEVTFITDPIFSQRASPVWFLGPKRFRGPPCTVSQLPKIDAVLISHNHYDHLDYTTVRNLNARFGSELRWFVPLGLLEWMQKYGCENVIELDWWAENCIPGHDAVTFVFTPAQHWCKRTITDENKVLWGSWSVLGPENRFFFAGDTGYCVAFKEIGKRFGPFDLAAIPIGAYEPRWDRQNMKADIPAYWKSVEILSPPKIMVVPKVLFFQEGTGLSGFPLKTFRFSSNNLFQLWLAGGGMEGFGRMWKGNYILQGILNPSIPQYPARAEEASWMRSETSSKKKIKKEVQLPPEKALLGLSAY